MADKERRNSLLRSSISINSIKDSASEFSKGLTRTNILASGIIETTRKRNLATSRSTAKDNEYFRKRRENIRRKNREDELESSTVSGVTKKEGNILQRSTKGFLGRILDFFGIILIGWFVNTLPKILDGLGKLANLVKSFVGLLSGFVEGVKEFFTGMSLGIKQAMDALPKFDFINFKNQSEKDLKSTEDAMVKLRTEFEEGTTNFSKGVNDTIFTKDVNKDGDLMYGDDIEKAYAKALAEAQGTESEGNTDTKKEDTDTRLFGVNVSQGGIFGSIGRMFGGDSSKEEEELDKELETDRNDNFVQRQPSFIKTEAQRNAEIEAEGDEEFNKKMGGLQIEGISPNVSTIEQAKDIDELRQGMETEDAKPNEDLNKPTEEEKFNKGGKVEGKPGIDQVLAKLTSGEFIMTKETTERIGANFLDMLNKGGEIEQMIKPKDDMIESIQTKLIDKTEAIANLTKERMGSTVIMMDGRQTNVSPPPAPVSGGSKGGISIVETNPLSKLHHILHRYT